MKKIFTLFALLVFSQIGRAQTLLVDDFTYSGDLAANGWNIHSGTADPILTTTGLTFPGYVSSGIGNAANVIGAGYDYNKGFANQTGNGNTIFLSAMIRVTETAAASGGYFLHLGDRSDTDSTTFTLFSARLFAKTDALGNVNFGISNTSTGTYGTTNFALNTTYLVVIKYTINTSGNDDVSLFVLSAAVPATEAGLGTPELALSTTAGQDNIDAVGIRQASGIPDVIVDGLRIGNTYNTTILPLKLSSFRGTLQSGIAKLQWQTNSESNVRGYSVEKSLNGSAYNEIAFVNANNRPSNSYDVTDNDVVSGSNYYRLKMIDIDGSFTYSNVVVLSNKSTIKTDVFPNPVVNSITVRHEKSLNKATITVLTIDGRQVKSVPVEAGATQTSFSLSDLVKGNYMIIFTNNGERSVVKFTKQ